MSLGRVIQDLNEKGGPRKSPRSSYSGYSGQVYTVRSRKDTIIKIAKFLGILIIGIAIGVYVLADENEIKNSNPGEIIGEIQTSIQSELTEVADSTQPYSVKVTEIDIDSYRYIQDTKDIYDITIEVKNNKENTIKLRFDQIGAVYSDGQQIENEANMFLPKKYIGADFFDHGFTLYPNGKKTFHVAFPELKPYRDPELILTIEDINNNDEKQFILDLSEHF
jgi:hypothetical protein